MTLQKLIKVFNGSPKWTVCPPSGLPELSHDAKAPNVTIPPEVLQFYELCGGLKSNVLRDEDLFLSIVPPHEFTWAIKKIFSIAFEKLSATFEKDRVWYWYLIGHGDTDEYFVIDLAPDRHGVSYFTRRYFFAQHGWTPVIATSFTGLLQQLFEAAKVGEEWSWNNVKLGDAYD